MSIKYNEGKKQNTLIGGALSLSFAAIVVKILGVIYKVPISYILTDEGMGYFNSAYAVYGFFYILCTAGVPKAVTVLITEAREKGTDYDEKRIFRITLALFFALGLLITFLFIILAEPLSKLVGNSKATAALLAIAPSILFVSLSGVIRGYFGGYSALVPVAVSQVIEAVGKLALGLLFANIGVRLGFSLPMISAFAVLGITLGAFFSCLYLYIASFSLNKNEKAGQKGLYTKKQIVSRIVKIALPVSFSSSVLSLSNIVDLGLIMRGLKAGGMTEAGASAVYGNYTTLAVPMLNLVVSILTPISVACLPRLTFAHLKGERGDFDTVFSNAARITAFISLPCATVFVLYGYTVLDVLFSPAASVVGAPLLATLAPAAVLLPLLTLVNTSLEATGNFKIPVISLALGSVIKIIISGLLISKGNFGIYAAPLGTVFSYLTGLIFSLSFCKIRGITKSLILIYGEYFVKSVLSFGIPYLFVFTLQVMPYGKFGLYVTVCFSCVIYLVLTLSHIIKHKKDFAIC